MFNKKSIDTAIYSCFGVDSIDREDMEQVFSDFMDRVDGETWDYLQDLMEALMDRYYGGDETEINMEDILGKVYFHSQDEEYDLFCEEIVKAHDNNYRRVNEISYSGIRTAIKSDLQPLVSQINGPLSNEDKFVSLVLGEYIKESLKKADDMDFMRSLYQVDEAALLKKVNKAVGAIKATDTYKDAVEDFLRQTKEREMAMNFEGIGTKLYGIFEKVDSSNYDEDHVPLDLDNDDYVTFVENLIEDEYVR